MSETVLEAFLNKTLVLAKKDSGVYNVADHPDFHRGDMGKDKPKVACIYSLVEINARSRLAYVQSWDAWGSIYEGVFPMHTLILRENATKQGN